MCASRDCKSSFTSKMERLQGSDPGNGSGEQVCGSHRISDNVD
jgi:hypothetical protein